jgi:putative holliday junction resolvase
MILALDYGEKNIGIALSDEEEIFSFPFEVFSTALIEHDPTCLGKKIPRFTKITEIIIGLPKNLKNEDTPQTLKVRSFHALISATYAHLPVKLVDERLTSAQYMKTVHTAGGNTKKTREKKDMYEAALLLEYYIKLRKNEKEISSY